MKKHLGFLIVVCVLVALLAATLAACDPNPSNPLGPDNNPAVSSYTVTFDLNGAAFEFDELAPIKNVQYGATIPEPKHNGQSIVLQKRGYDFKGWTVGSTDFVFGVTQIVSNTTIRAKFEAQKYYHILDIYSTVKYDADAQKYEINKEGHATLASGTASYSDGNVLKNSLGEDVKDSAGNTTKMPNTNVILPKTGPETTLYSTFAATTPSKVGVPTRTNLDGSDDNFCFWYYMTDTLDEDGNPVTEDGTPNGKVLQHPVQFTEWAAKGATEVAVRSVTYNFTEPLHLYAMFESDLPDVTVEYYESEKEGAKLLNTDTDHRLGKNILEEEKYTPVFSETIEHQEGYDFNYWYFVYFTENEDEEGDPIRNVQKFVFDAEDENGNSTVKDATSPMDAAHDDEIPAVERNFRPVTLKLYANWVQKITISNVADYDALVKRFDRDVADATTWAEDLESLLTATIRFASDINFDGTQLKPLFDAEHPFRGIIDGGKYTTGEDDEQVLSGRVTLSNATVKGENHSSLFGYVNGTIKNIALTNCTFETTATSATFYLGAFASVSGGAFAGCDVSAVTFKLPADATGFAYIGGLAGQLVGTANDKDKGSINECSVSLTIENLTADGLCIGGFAGESGSSTTISNCTANLTVQHISTTAAGGPYSGLRIGGLAGNSTAAVSACEATLTISSVTAKGLAYLGGLLGQSAGNISRSTAAFTSTADVKTESTAPMQTAAIGGLVGLNEGYLTNCYADVNLKATVLANQTAYMGGLIGSNSSGRGDSGSDQEVGTGAINRCYTTGTIQLIAQDGLTSAQLYAGGIAGYSKHSKFARNFTLVDVSVTYNTQKTDLIHAGFIFGLLDKNAAFTSGYYANENRVTVNDKTIYGSDFAPKQDEGESTDAQTDDSGIFSLGTPRPKSDFSDKDIVFGTSTDEKQLGWVGGNNDASKNIWEFKEEGVLPTLVNIGCPQE